MTPEQIEEIRRLRDRKLAPKQIARKLGLRPAEVKTAIQQQAATQQQEALARGELPPIEICLANGGMVDALFRGGNTSKLSGSAGLGTVMVVRKQRTGFTASVFLIDYYCLGIKNASSKKLRDDSQYRQMKEMVFTQFLEGAEEISLSQAQAIVWGAVN
ncbi:MAG: hypothetical protein WA885_09830 [Phormidesmis sp.]